MGAYNTSHILANSSLSKRVVSAIFIDPADYYLNKEDEVDGGGTWSGLDEYKSEDKTASDLHTYTDSDVKVHLINFTLRNYSKDGYVAEDKRNIDDPTCLPRSNDDMVKKFYENTHDKNKGEYVEENTLPHAFLDDGDIEKNVTRVARIIIEIIRS